MPASGFSLINSKSKESKGNMHDKFSYSLGSGKGRADLRAGTGAINITVK